MKQAIPILTTLLLSVVFVGCGDDSATTSRKMAEWALDQKKQSDAIEVENQKLELEIVELSQGRLAATTLRVCFYKGYPKAPDKSLSRREIAECYAIVKAQERIDARQAAEKKKKDDEYDKKHPE
jgi:hypothetical protein